MTAPPPQGNLKHWQRRALKAEETVALLQRIRENESRVEAAMVHELATARVALAEIREAIGLANAHDSAT